MALLRARSRSRLARLLVLAVAASGCATAPRGASGTPAPTAVRLAPAPAPSAASLGGATDPDPGRFGPEPAVLLAASEAEALEVARRRLGVRSAAPVVSGALVLAARDLARRAAAAEPDALGLRARRAALTAGLAYDPAPAACLVRGPAELAEAARLGASEARGAFGDGAIYLEKALDRPRHVELQILADAHGHVVHLGERECSIQRRHQKLVEETPSPAVDAELRRRMGEAAITVARAGGYVGAGTVEFLLVPGGFHFLEVNARLQVEHPITELVTGLDLVRAQIEIAAGAPLAFGQEDVAPRGHAIECRVYAEDPARGFLPAPGRVLLAREPRGPGVRCDSGVVSGTDVPVQYDPILAKVSVHASGRDAAIARMLRALETFVVLGVPTPIELLLDVLRSEPFRAGRTHTGFLAEHFAAWRPTDDARLDRLAVAGAALEGRAPAPPAVAADAPPQSPWQRLGGWDLAGAAAPRPAEGGPCKES